MIYFGIILVGLALIAAIWILMCIVAPFPSNKLRLIQEDGEYKVVLNGKTLWISSTLTGAEQFFNSYEKPKTIKSRKL